jgi:RNA polymerase sigma factor (sigma-70 family)
MPPSRKPSKPVVQKRSLKSVWNRQEIEKRVSQNQGLIWAFAKKNSWVSMFLSREEIEREGNFALFKAAQQWDPKRGKFSTLSFITLRRQFTDAIDKKQKHTAVSIDYSTDGEDPLKTRLIEKKAVSSPRDEVLRNRILNAINAFKMNSKRYATPIEKEIVLESFGIEAEPLTDEQIAQKHGLSIPIIRRIRQQALSQIRRQFPELEKLI